MVGDVDADRVRRVVRGLRGEESAGPDDPARLERDILSALRGNPNTRRLDITVRALGGRLVELTGTVPDETARETARSLAAEVHGADVVVNRILVEGVDTNDQSAASVQ
jgi:osmotically-inducible protein OsmY